jgi:hypothetical protein
MAPLVRAGEEGWSVTVTLDAPQRAPMMDGKAVPINIASALSQLLQPP